MSGHVCWTWCSEQALVQQGDVGVAGGAGSCARAAVLAGGRYQLQRLMYRMHAYGG
jgi:hypothetical protein